MCSIEHVCYPTDQLKRSCDGTWRIFDGHSLYPVHMPHSSFLNTTQRNDDYTKHASNSNISH